jgi:hypothetical protein
MNFNKEFLKELKIQINNYSQKCSVMVVSKNRPIEIIREILNEKHHLFGENKVQEADQKFSILRSEFENIELHLIGPLQTNKVATALKIFDTIQTIDREKLVNEIIKKRNENTITKGYYIQVNIGKEEQKSGVAPEHIADFYNFCLENNLNIIGLMCIPPNDLDVQKYFKKMNEIKETLCDELHLSMGMSNDYKIALDSKSNLIRIGSAFFS